MKLRAPTKIAIGTVAAMASVWFGYQIWATIQVDSVTFAPVEPGRVNLLAVDPGAGYRIKVSNQVAQLEEMANADFSAPDMATGQADTNSRRRIPIREMLASLNGDAKSLSYVVATLNDMKESSLPPVRINWTAEEIRRALAGDPAIVAKLTRNLNVRLDGTPLGEVRPAAIENGIVVSVPVPVQVNVKGKPVTLTATILLPFLPTFAKQVTNRYAEKADVTNSMILGFYREEAQRVLTKAAQPQDVRAALTALIDPKRLANLAKAPARLFGASRVVVNNQAIRHASYQAYQSNDGRDFYDVRLELTEEGRKRMWQYSRKNRGFQLLFVVDGIAIAAPRISTELPQSVVVIKQVTDETLVQDAVAILNGEAPGVRTVPKTQGDQG